MADSGIGDYFISDVEDDVFEDDDLIIAPVVVAPAPAPVIPMAPDVRVAEVAPHPAPATATARAPLPVGGSREERLVECLNGLIARSTEIQAAALVSLDGFTMASALPPGMQEDRVGAMSAAILGLGERAAVELGKGRLTQVFIEGDDGYVLLVNAGVRAVLTVLAAQDAKLGLVLYDMKSAAAEMGEILG